MKNMLTLLGFVFNKKMCTKEQFIAACNSAKEIAEKDEDGFISVKEAICIVIRLILSKGQ